MLIMTYLATLGLDWDKLPEGSTVVDVGGGVGTSMVPLVENFPGLKIVVQDLPQTIQNARQVRSDRYFWLLSLTLHIHLVISSGPRRIRKQLQRRGYPWKVCRILGITAVVCD